MNKNDDTNDDRNEDDDGAVTFKREACFVFFFFHLFTFSPFHLFTLPFLFSFPLSSFTLSCTQINTLFACIQFNNQTRLLVFRSLFSPSFSLLLSPHFYPLCFSLFAPL